MKLPVNPPTQSNDNTNVASSIFNGPVGNVDSFACNGKKHVVAQPFDVPHDTVNKLPEIDN